VEPAYTNLYHAAGPEPHLKRVNPGWIPLDVVAIRGIFMRP
jgi:hypothetical protein